MLAPTRVELSLGILLLYWIGLILVSSYAKSLHALNGSASEILRESPSRRNRRGLKLIQEKHEFQIVLSTLGTVLCVGFVLQLFQSTFQFGLTPYPPGLWTLTIITLCISVLVAITYQIIPRFLSLRYPLGIALAGADLAFFLHLISAPITRPISSWFQSNTGYGKPDLQYLSGEDLKAMADIGEAQGTLEEDERELIHSIVDFRDAEVKEVMINRMDMDALPITATLSDALHLIQESGHSRLPLYEEHLDNILGIVYAKDLIPYLSSSNGSPAPDWRHLARTPFFVPSSKPLDELLRDFQSKKKHLAIVLDEYGGTAGLVTMEDVLEEIVGDIRDEFDEGEEDFHSQVSETTYLFDARINLDDLCEVLDIHLDTEKFDFETLGGLIFHIKGDVPERGDQVQFDTLMMRIESIENHRIGRVLIQLSPPTEDLTAVL